MGEVLCSSHRHHHHHHHHPAMLLQLLPTVAMAPSLSRPLGLSSLLPLGRGGVYHTSTISLPPSSRTCFSLSNFHICRPAALLLSPRLSRLVQSSRVASVTHGKIPSNVLCRSSLMEESTIEDKNMDASGGQVPPQNEGDGGGGGDGGGAMGWASTAFIFAIWAAFIAYCSLYSPNQTPAFDQYFLERLLLLKADDGYQMNQVLVSLWYIMAIWPTIYCMLLIPSGRSSESGVPVWPFSSLSFFVGAFALLPYFGLWRPPPPAISKEEIDGWPLKILDSKLFSVVLFVAGAILVGVALFSGGDTWKEFLQFFNSSRFIHIMSLDFLAFSSLAPFWVYNDMEARKWSNQSSWIAALAFIPFLGPALYLILRPSLTIDMTKDRSLK